MLRITHPYKRWVRPKLRSLEQRYRYGSSPKSYQLITIDPSSINHITFPKFSQEYGTYGTHIVDGDWDQRVTKKSLYYSNSREQVLNRRHLLPLENYKLYVALEDRFVRGKDWEDTEFYQWAVDNLRGTDAYYNEEIIDDRLAFLDGLYQDIKENGYKTREELQPSSNNRIKNCLKIPERHEVMISIGRNGRMAVDEGRHRFSIAKILGRKIPVRVLVRHELWQKKRQRVRNGKVRHKNHPDLQHLS